MVIAIFSVLLLFQQPIEVPQPRVESSNGLNFIQYDFRYFTNSLMQASDGTLWIGTSYGLIAFDGRNAHFYSESVADTAQLGFYGSDVISISEDSEQNIWVGTNRGSINVLRKDSVNFESFYRLHRGLPFAARTILEVTEGEFWTHAGISLGWFKLTDQIEETVLHSKIFRPGEYGEFRRFYQSPEKKKYLLADGIYEVLYDEANGITLHQVLEGAQFSDIILLSEGKYLIQDRNQVLIWSEHEGRIDTLKANEIKGSYVRSVMIDDKRHLWVGCRDGVLKYAMDHENNLRFIGEYAIGEVRDMIQDRTGNLFFSTSSGLMKLNRDYEQYHFNELPPEYKSDYLYNYLTDRQGNLWIGTHRNLLKYQADKETYTAVLKDQIYSILEYDEKSILVGSSRGVRLIDIQTGDVIDSFNNDMSHKLRKVAEDTFIGIEKRRAFLIRNKVLSYLDSVPGVVLMDYILVDEEKNVWAVNSKTLIHYVFEDSTLSFREVVIDNKIPANVNWMEDDLTGNLWMGTDIGVIIFDKKEKKITKALTTENGLMDNQTFEIIRDRSGLMWVKQSREGSTAFQPGTTEKVANTPSWLTKSGNTNRYCVSYSSEDGTLYTDGSGGYYTFHPDSLNDLPLPPQIKLQSFTINGDPVAKPRWRTSLQLTHDKNDISINYAGIQFDDPLKNRFRYKLDGYEELWNDVRDRTDAQYLSLPAGTYRFLIKGSNSSGVWGEEVELASFEISPPWWRSYFAYAAYAASLLLILYSFLKLQFNRKLALAETKRLNEIDQFKNRFFTNITHEFRTPLTVITGLAGRIDDEKGQSIKRNAQKLLGLINQILELSKMESAKHRLIFEKADILAYIRYMVQSYASYAHENDLLLSVDSDEEAITAYFDRPKLSLIIGNLISNAIKFTPAGGSVSVFVSADTNRINLAVSDTGIGISEEDRVHIFDRYYQSDAVRSGSQGSGIGLSLTEELVSLMGGEISVESQPGEGSVFKVILPRVMNIDPDHADQNDKERSAEEIEAKPDAEQERNVILIIEDNPDVLDFVKTVVSEEFEVITAKDGDEGLRKALKTIPDLIISDVMMPGKNGIEITRTLKSDPSTDHIPIILLTAKVDTESRLEGLGQGAEVYLGKPFNEEELMIHLRNLLAHRDRLREKYSGEEFSVETAEDEFITRVRETLLSHISDEAFGIEAICREVGISRSQLHRKLKALTGYSSAIYLRNIRLKEARKLLRSSSYSIAEIAYKVGFGDPNYFSKVYAGKFGHSATKERQKAAKA